MGGAGGMDIRLPMGLMFGLLGIVLTVWGVISDKAIYTASLDININLWWGLVMTGFGLFMLLLCWMSKSKRA